MPKIPSKTTHTSISAHLLLLITRPPAQSGNENNNPILNVRVQSDLLHYAKGCCQPTNTPNVRDGACLSIELDFSNVLEIQIASAI